MPAVMCGMNGISDEFVDILPHPRPLLAISMASIRRVREGELTAADFLVICYRSREFTCYFVQYRFYYGSSYF